MQFKKEITRKAVICFKTKNEKQKSRDFVVFLFTNEKREKQNQKTVSFVFCKFFFHFSSGTDSRTVDRQEAEVKCKNIKIKAKRIER